MHPQQLEFDLVSPSDPGVGPLSDALEREAQRLGQESGELHWLAKLAADLDRQEWLAGPLQRPASSELEELRILIGPSAWKKQGRQWAHRARKNLAAVRKVIVCLRALYDRQQQTKQ